MGYLPVDLASCFLNLGCLVGGSRDHDRPVLFVLYDDRRIPLEATVTEYLQRGAELLFMTDWQHALTSIDDDADMGNPLKARLVGLRD